VTISDKKLAVSANGTTIDYYNVLVTVSDKRIPVDQGTYVKVCTTVYNPITETASQTCVMNLTSLDPDGIIDYYNADVITANDYYPFGMQMPSRKYAQPNSGYRYGFNGQENDKDAGEGIQDYGERIYDGRLGKWLSVDPSYHLYPSLLLTTLMVNG
jgi:RHS repeat-associated protein